ncbi:hypothetical protein BH09CHL1_BH09CHL1_06540 [soil metagenome]
MSTYARARLHLLALMALVLASSVASNPALARADNTVYVSIEPSGTVTAEIYEGYLPSIDYSTRFQEDEGVLLLRVNDLRGSSAGWCVSIVSSDFVYEGTSKFGRAIGAGGFQIHSASSPELIAGQPIVPAGPNFNPLLGATLEIPRTVLWAAPGSGSGDYLQEIKVIWNVPGNAQSGTYSAVMTVTVSSAP